MKTIAELASGDTTSTTVRGSSITQYALQPTVWLKKIIEAAKKKHYFAQFAYQTELQPGQASVVIPKRSKMLGSGDYASSASEGAAVTYTKLNNLDGVQITPSDYNYGIAISYKAIRTNNIDLLRAAREELTYYAGELVDIAVRDALVGATAATSSTAGAQTVYGGDAKADSQLAAGDILTTSMIAEAKRKLESPDCKYWTLGSSEGTSSATKNPWLSTPEEPFVLFIAPEQQEALLNDTQFVNASEYGSDKVIHSGEIGELYLGVKVIVSPNVKSYSTSDSSPDGESGGNPGVDMHRCVMIKAGKAVALAWGQKPKLHAFDYPSELEKRIILELSYGTSVLHDDAIVWLDVAKE